MVRYSKTKIVYKLLSAFFSPVSNLLKLDYLVVFEVKSVKKRVNTFLMQNIRDSQASHNFEYWKCLKYLNLFESIYKFRMRKACQNPKLWKKVTNGLSILTNLDIIRISSDSSEFFSKAVRLKGVC